MRRWTFGLGAALLAGALVSADRAEAFPWDIDMVDSYFYRAYEWAMMTLPEGTVSRDMVVAPSRYTPEGMAMQNPYADQADQVATGEAMFNIYCATCHGAEGKGGAPVADNASGKRYPVPPSPLSGENNVSALRSDGYLYLTIRSGGAIMPAYGTQMDDHEMWGIVSYLRTIDGTGQ